MKVPSFLKKPPVRYTVAGFLFALGSYGGFLLGRPIVREYQSSFAAKEFHQYGVVGTYQKHFFGFVSRLQGLANLERENEELQSRLAELDRKTTLEATATAERDLASLNEHLESKLKDETGSAEARIPQSVTYELPEHLNHPQLYSLALGYFRKQEFEKSAVIFTALLEFEDDHVYLKPENFLMDGISWFRLKEYNRANKAVLEAEKKSAKNDPVHRQALIWHALIEKTLGHEKIAQVTLLNFLGQYPHSEEGRLINGERKPASVPPVENSAPHSEKEVEHHETHSSTHE